MHLILIRGLPGSGKTSFANLLSENQKYPTFSVDDYFTSPSTNKYEFRFQDNHLAYKACEENVKQAMEKNTEKIIVHNTFTMDWEMEPYFTLAKKFRYKIHVVTMENRHGGRNVHDIPQEQIEKMAEKYKLKLF